MGYELFPKNSILPFPRFWQRAEQTEALSRRVRAILVGIVRRLLRLSESRGTKRVSAHESRYEHSANMPRRECLGENSSPTELCSGSRHEAPPLSIRAASVNLNSATTPRHSCSKFLTNVRRD
jgi:hypothetical protein